MVGVVVFDILVLFVANVTVVVVLLVGILVVVVVVLVTRWC